jgi:hypothetical protein
MLSTDQKHQLLDLITIKARFFSLLWRGTRDGFEASTFHKLCDAKSNTLTVVKSTEGCIFGGYASLPWANIGGYKTDASAFLFTLINPSKQPLKLKVVYTRQAVYHNSYCGPSFGNFDLFIDNMSNKAFNTSCIKPYTYEYPFDLSGIEGGKFFLGHSNHFFQAAEIEVFEIF